MKKVLSIFLICLFSIFSFVGCGIYSSTELKTVAFTKDTFYVDLGVESVVEYKVYPSTATGVNVSYTVDIDYAQSGFTFKNGVVKIVDEEFTGATIHLLINGNEVDDCRVVLKEYPSSIFFDKDPLEEIASLAIDSGSVLTLPLKGLFDEERLCGNGEFEYKITSSDQSVIQVADASSLKIKSTGRRGFSEITVKLLKSNGEEVEGLSAKIKVFIKDSVDQSFVIFDNQFALKNNTILNLNTVLNSEFDLQVKYYDKDGFYLENEEYEIYLSNQNVVEVLLKSKIKIIGEGSVDVLIQSKSASTTKVPHSILFSINVDFS